MEDDGFGSFPKFESAPAAAPAAEQPQTVPAAQRPQTAPAAERKVRVVGITEAAEQKSAPPAAAAGGSGSSLWGGWGGGWLSSAASAMPQSTAALDSMSSMMSVTSMRASANAAAERLTAAMPVTAAAMDAMSPIAAANNLSSLREKVSAALQKPGGQAAMVQSIAESYVSELSAMAQKSNLIMIPEKVSDVSSVLTTALAIGKNIPNLAGDLV